MGRRTRWPRNPRVVCIPLAVLAPFEFSHLRSISLWSLRRRPSVRGCWPRPLVRRPSTRSARSAPVQVRSSTRHLYRVSPRRPICRSFGIFGRRQMFRPCSDSLIVRFPIRSLPHELAGVCPDRLGSIADSFRRWHTSASCVCHRLQTRPDCFGLSALRTPSPWHQEPSFLARIS